MATRINPWYDENNPLINLNSQKMVTHYCGAHPLARVVEVPSGRPLFNPKTVDREIEELDGLAHRSREIAVGATRMCNYLRWKKLEEEHK